MTRKELGYTDDLDQYSKENNLEGFQPGRVISEHRERYVVLTDTGEYEAELMGNLRFAAESRYDFPAVGDWVAISAYDVDKALIHAIYPRHSLIERQAVGKVSQKQIIATNIDWGLIVQAVNRDFNVNRLERYLTICHAAKVKPVIILSKIDLVDESELKTILDAIQARIEGVPILPISNETYAGHDAVKALIEVGKTYCLLGSSGVGKSTLLNALAGKDQMKTGAISQSVDRGKHVTSHRELVILEGGGILIDNPGMREVGITDVGSGLESTFDAIVSLTSSCKFTDCSHINEKGCAVLAALDAGEIDEASYENYQKMQREKSHFESSIQEKRKKDKEMGKLYKRIQQEKRDKKY